MPEVQSEDMSWEQEWCREQHEGDVWQDSIARWTKHAATPAEARMYRIWEQTGLGMDQTVTRVGRQGNEAQDRSMLTANTRMEIYMYQVSTAGQLSEAPRERRRQLRAREEEQGGSIAHRRAWATEEHRARQAAQT